MIRTLRGTVVSDKMDKTVVVAVNSLKEHPIYRKKYKVTTKFKAHDAENTCHVGDLVEITETRPLSADKRWLVARKVSAKEMEA
jgi:small subunit ribosomal protein S17